MTGLRTPARNWGGNVTFEARRVLRPRSVDELAGMVAGADRIRALGTGHSFSRVADGTGDLVTLADLPPRFELGEDTVTVAAGLRFGDIVGPLDAAGRALHNLGSLPHIAVGGAVATGTHGSGDGNPCLAAAVVGLELVTAGGELVRLDRGDPDFDGSVVALGRLGVVTAVTLRTLPTYDIQQVVYEDLPFDALEDLGATFGEAYSVSLFTRYHRPVLDMAWVKRRVVPGAPWLPPDSWSGGVRAHEQRHPVPGERGDECTPQDGLPGPWHTRLPHFRLEFTPSKGEEIQSEYFVAREHGAAAVRAVRSIGDRIGPLLLVGEIRTIAADPLWTSMAYERDSVALHFTWVRDQAGVERATAEVEAALAPFAARPHWGKVFTMPAEEVRGRWDRLADLRRLADKLDPDGVFANDFTDRYL